MEKKNTVFGSFSSSSSTMVFLFLGFALLVMLPETSATRFMVGGNMGWNTNFNYTTWAKEKHFYNGDWLCKHPFSLSNELKVWIFASINVVSVYTVLIGSELVHSWDKLKMLTFSCFWYLLWCFLELEGMNQLLLDLFVIILVNGYLNLIHGVLVLVLLCQCYVTRIKMKFLG